MSQLLVNNITPSTGDTLIVNGVIINNGVLSATTYENLPNNGGGGYITVSLSEAQQLIANSGLTEGSFYKVTGTCEFLTNYGLYRGGTDVILIATSTNQFTKRGWGIFYNPKYNESIVYSGLYDIWNQYYDIEIAGQTGIFQNGEKITGDGGQKGELIGIPGKSSLTLKGTGDWSSVTSFTGDSSSASANLDSINRAPIYNIGDKVIWGGYVWVNVTGNIGNSNGVFNLNEDWELVPYNETDYVRTVDVIDYEIENDIISYRTDGYNEVSSNTLYIGNELPYNTIRAFPWGGCISNGKIDNSNIDGLLNFNGGGLSNLLFEPKSIFNITYCAPKVTIENITLGYLSKFTNIIIGKAQDVGEIYVGDNSLINYVTIADNASFKSIYVGPSEVSTGIQNVDLYGDSEFYNINLNAGGSLNYIINLILNIDARFHNINMEDNTYMNGIIIRDTGRINNCKLGQFSYFGNIDVGVNSSMFNIITEGDIDMSTKITQIQVGDMNYFSNLKLGVGAYINQINMENAQNCVFEKINLEMGSYIQSIILRGANNKFNDIDTGLSCVINNVTFENDECHFSRIKLDNNSGISSIIFNDKGSVFENITIGQQGQISGISFSGDCQFAYITLSIKSIISAVQFNGMNSSITNTTIGIDSYLANIYLKSECLLSEISLGERSYMSQIAFNGDNGVVKGINMDNLTSISNVTLNIWSRFESINLNNLSNINEISIGDDGLFQQINVLNGTNIINVIVDVNSAIRDFNLGIGATIDGLTVNNNALFTVINLGDRMSIEGLTVSSTTENKIISIGKNTFPATLDITNTINIDYSLVPYAGIITLTSSNVNETITRISNSSEKYPITFMSQPNLTVTFSGTSVGNLSTSDEIIMPYVSFNLSGDTYDYIEIQKENYNKVISSQNYI